MSGEIAIPLPVYRRPLTQASRGIGFLPVCRTNDYACTLELTCHQLPARVHRWCRCVQPPAAKPPASMPCVVSDIFEKTCRTCVAKGLTALSGSDRPKPKQDYVLTADNFKLGARNATTTPPVLPVVCNARLRERGRVCLVFVDRGNSAH